MKCITRIRERADYLGWQQTFADGLLAYTEVKARRLTGAGLSK